MCDRGAQFSKVCWWFWQRYGYKEFWPVLLGRLRSYTTGDWESMEQQAHPGWPAKWSLNWLVRVSVILCEFWNLQLIFISHVNTHFGSVITEQISSYNRNSYIIMQHTLLVYTYIHQCTNEVKYWKHKMYNNNLRTSTKLICTSLVLRNA